MLDNFIGDLRKTCTAREVLTLPFPYKVGEVDPELFNQAPDDLHNKEYRIRGAINRAGKPKWGAKKSTLPKAFAGAIHIPLSHERTRRVRGNQYVLPDMDFRMRGYRGKRGHTEPLHLDLLYMGPRDRLYLVTNEDTVSVPPRQLVLETLSNSPDDAYLLDLPFDDPDNLITLRRAFSNFPDPIHYRLLGSPDQKERRLRLHKILKEAAIPLEPYCVYVLTAFTFHHAPDEVRKSRVHAQAFFRDPRLL